MQKVKKYSSFEEMKDTAASGTVSDAILAERSQYSHGIDRLLPQHGNGDPIISNQAVASVTLFATSMPEEMDTVKNLTISILNRNQ